MCFPPNLQISLHYQHDTRVLHLFWQLLPPQRPAFSTISPVCFPTFCSFTSSLPPPLSLQIPCANLPDNPTSRYMYRLCPKPPQWAISFPGDSNHWLIASFSPQFPKHSLISPLSLPRSPSVWATMHVNRLLMEDSLLILLIMSHFLSLFWYLISKNSEESSA